MSETRKAIVKLSFLSALGITLLGLTDPDVNFKRVHQLYNVEPSSVGSQNKIYLKCIGYISQGNKELTHYFKTRKKQNRLKINLSVQCPGDELECKK